MMATLFGERGYLAPLRWAAEEQAHALARYLTAIHQPDNDLVVRNPHMREDWATDIVAAPNLLNRVCGLIGTDPAIDQSFLVMKWPHVPFAVPAHQDGVSVDIELDPLRSVSCWLAISDAPEESGALQVSEGSHEWDYLPHAFDETGALAARGDERLEGCAFTSVPIAAGQGVLFDTRLLHRSRHNVTARPRIGLNIVYTHADAYRRGSASQREGWMPVRLP